MADKLTIRTKINKQGLNIYIPDTYRKKIVRDAEDHECSVGDIICAYCDYYHKNKNTDK